MTGFYYQAKDARGELHEGVIQTSERHEAIQLLQGKGYIPLRLEAQAATKVLTPSPKAAFVHPSPKIPLRVLLQFSTDLRDLLSAGMTLSSGIHMLSKQGGNPQRQALLKQVYEDIIQGSTLSEALGKHPRSFPEFYVSLVEAGEASGQLQEALETAVIHYERAAEAKEQIRGALAYPMLVAGFGVLVIIFCLIFVIPKFSQIFTDMDRILPLPTRMLLFLSMSILKYGWLFLILTVAAAFGFKRWKNTESGRMAWHRFLLQVPVFKNLIRSAAYSNFARTLSHLLENGVSVLYALDIVKKTANNAVMEKEIGNLKSRVTDGSSLSGPLAESGIFPDVFTDMLAIGEEAGQVSRSLAQIARRYDQELNRNIKKVTTLIEPLLMVFIAGMVGFVAISMLLPLFQLTQGL